MEYPWYTLLDEDDLSLEQGDILRECPVMIPPNITMKGGDTVSSNIKIYDVIILSQSCDLANKKISIVQVSPFFNIEEYDFIKNANNSEKISNKNKLRQGNLPGLHLLNQCEINQHKTDFLIVDFRNVYGVDFAFLVEFVKNSGKRLRLNPPYKEHLSQSFARYFMRVGLPTDLPAFK
jgi:hypothetical protein